MATRMQQRRGTAAQWISTNSGNGPILAAGEIGYESDTNKFKIGDGTNHWLSLDYFMDADSTTNPQFGSSIVFEGTTANAFETTLSVTDPTADRAIILPDAAGTVVLANSSTGDVTISGDLTVSGTTTTINSTTINATTGIVFEGSTADAHETTISVVDPTADRAIQFPNAGGTVALVSDVTERLSKAGGTMTGGVDFGAQTLTNLPTPVGSTEAATKGYVDTNFLALTGGTLTGSLIFEGTTADGYETTLIVTDPTADRTIYLPNVDGTIITTGNLTDITNAGVFSQAITFEGTTADGYETTLIAIDPTGDRTIYLPNTDGTLALVSDISTQISTHESDTTSIHGIVDTANLVTTGGAQTLGGAKTFTGDTVLPVNTSIGTVTSTEIGYVAGVTSAIQTQLDNKQAVNANVSTTELGYLDGVTSAIQTQINAKAPLASPTFTGTVTTGHILPATNITSDLGSPSYMWRDIYVGPGSLYVNGQKVLQTDSGDVVVTADADQNLVFRTSGDGNIEIDPTGSGSVTIKAPLVIQSGHNVSMSDGSAVNFTGAIKLDTISSKTTNTDLSLSADGTGKVYLNDNAEVSGNLVVGGNLTVSGTTTTVNSETITLADNIIDLNSNFTSGVPSENAGIKIKRGDSADVQIRWNESTDKWDFTNDGTNYSSIAGIESPTFTGTVTIPSGASISGFAPLASPTFTGTVTVAAAGVVFTDGTQTKEGVPSRTSIIQKTAAYTLSAANERDSLIEVSHTGGSAVLISIPTDATFDFPIGTSIDILRTNTGEVTIEAVTSGTTTVNATPGLKLRAQWSSATLFKRAANLWVVMGDLKA